MITFTRKSLIGNTFLDDKSIDQILKNQENAKKYSKLIELSFNSSRIRLDDALEKILEGDNAN